MKRLENNSINNLKKALGMPNENNLNTHPEMKTLEEQESVLEKTLGAVMQCGTMESKINVEPLIKAGIKMICEIDRCRELNKMVIFLFTLSTLSCYSSLLIHIFLIKSPSLYRLINHYLNHQKQLKVLVQ